MLTGDDWEQVYIEELLPKKLALDLEYVRNNGVVRDIRVMLNTLKAILYG